MTGPPAQVELGYQLLRQGRQLDALRLSGQVLQSSPENPHALVLAAEAHLQDEKPDAIRGYSPFRGGARTDWR